MMKHTLDSLFYSLSAVILIAVVSLFIGLPTEQPAMSGDAIVEAKVTRFGEVTLRETTNGGYLASESLANLSYAQGAMQWWLAPEMTMLKAVVALPQGPAQLNEQKLNELFAAPPEEYFSPLRALTGLIRLVAPEDGTLRQAGPQTPTIEQMRNYFTSLGVIEDAEVIRAGTSAANQKILRRWLQGAKFMAMTHKNTFEARHPHLRELRLVDAFLAITEDDLYRLHAIESLLYDAGQILGTMGLVSGWIIPEPLGTPYAGPENLASPDSLFPAPRAEGIGASNAAAFTYYDGATGTRECVAVGEPHLPSTYFGPLGYLDAFPGGAIAQAKIARMYVNDRGDVKPFIAFYHAGYLGVPVLSASKGHATGLTAGPSGAGFVFFAETNGTQYRGENGEWLPFEVRMRTYTFNGQQVSVPEYYVPGFGKVFGYVQQPTTQIRYVLSIRLRSAPLTAESILTKVRAGIANDISEFQRAVRLGAAFWGESGCAPAIDPSAPRLAYAALNQGRPDLVQDPAAQNIGANPLSPALRKVGELDTPACFDKRWTTSDNGTLRAGGCAGSFSGPNYLDPGFETTRQRSFARAVTPWAESDTAVPPLDIEQLATDTYGEGGKRFIELLTGTYRAYGDRGLFPGNIAAADALVSELELFDGRRRNTRTTVKVQHILEQLDTFTATSSWPFHVDIYRGMSDPARPIPEIIPEIGEDDATELIRFLKNTHDFYESACVPLGSPTWNEITSIQFAGETVASGFGGPGADSRSSGLWQFIRNSGGEIQCAARLRLSSPLKYIASRSTFRYLPYGPPVSPHSMDPSLHNIAGDEWWALWDRHNEQGEGYGGYQSYRTLSLDETEPSFAPNEVLHTFTFQVPDSAFPDCDSDGIPDSEESDTDEDGTPDGCEFCAADPAKTAPGLCGCGTPDQDSNENGIVDCNYRSEFQDATLQLQVALDRLIAVHQKDRKGEPRKFKKRLRELRRQLRAFSFARDNFLLSRPLSGENITILVRSSANAMVALKKGIARSPTIDRSKALQRAKRRLQRVWRVTLSVE